MLIAGVVAVVVGLVAFKIARNPPHPDPDNCVGTPQASTAIVIDRSDGVPQQTLSEIRSRALSYVADSVGDNERVTVFTVSDSSATALVPLVSLCRPRRQGNRLTEDVRDLEKTYQSKFRAPVESALRIRPGTSDASPLAQALTDISLSEYLRSKRNTLIVFSDMLENTQRFSLYHCTSPADVIPRFRASRTGAQERPRFTNTMVRLNIIPRFDQPPTEIACRDKLWTWFFGDDSGSAAGLSLDYLPGGPTVRPESEAKGR